MAGLTGELVQRGTAASDKARQWAEKKGFKLKKATFAQTLAMHIAMVQDGPSGLSDNEIKELVDELRKSS